MPPSVRAVHLLPASRDRGRFAGICPLVLDPLRKVACVAELKEDERIFIEVVQDPRGPRSDDGLADGQIFENSGRHIELREDAPAIGNDTDVTVLDRLDDLLQPLGAEKTNGGGEAPGA